MLRTLASFMVRPCGANPCMKWHFQRRTDGRIISADELSPGTKMGKLWTVGVDGCASKTLIKDTHRLGEQRRDLKFFRKAHSLPLNPTSLLHICILL